MSTNDNRRRFEELRKRLKESSGSRDNPAPDPKGTSYTSASQTGTDDARRRFEELRESLKNTGENKVSFDTWNEDDWKHDSEFINSFFTDAQKYLTDSAKAFDGISYSEAMDGQLRDARNQTSRDLADRADAAVAYINKYKDVIGEEEYARLIGDIQNFRSARLDIGSAYRNQERYYGRWDTEEAYNDHVQWQERVTADVDVLKEELEELKRQWENYEYDWTDNKQREQAIADSKKYEKLIREKQQHIDEATHYQNGLPYRDLMNASDFREKSQYVSTANGKKRNTAQRMFGVYTTESSGWDDPLYEYINGNQEAGSYIAAQAGSYGEGVVAAYEMMANGKTESQQMNEDEVAIFNYLYATQGKEAAYGYYEYLLSELTQRQRAEEEKYWAEYARESPVLASTFSVLTSPMKGLSYIGQLGDYAGDGTFNGKIDQNAAYNRFSYANSAIRGQVAKQIKESGKWGKVGSFAYQTGMSMGDFLMTTAVTGGNGAASMMIMGSGAAADTTIAAKDRGLSDDQAFALGTVAGLAEALCERVSLGSLLDGDLLRDSTGKYILKNMVAEGLEEVTTDGVNLVADILISKDQSEWQKSINAYRKKGKSPMAAFGLAVADQGLAMGLDFLGGAISGGIMSGGGAAINTTANHMQYTRDGRAILDTDGGVDALRQLANEVAGVSDIKMRDSITKQTQKLDDKVTPARVGKLYDTVRTADNQANPSTSQADIAQRLAGKSIQPESIKETAISDSKTTMDQRSVNTQKLREEGNAETTAKAVKLEDLEHYETAQDGITVDNEGNAVSIRGISSIKDGHVVLETEDGRTLDAGDVSYGSFAEAQVYEAVSELDGIIDTETANKMSKHLMRLGEVNSELYAKGIAQAYNYGYYGYGMKAAMREGTLSADLTEKQRNVAYMTGRNYREAQVKAEQARKSAEKKASISKAAATDKGGVFFQDSKGSVVSYDEAGIKTNAKRESGVQTAKVLKMLGLGGRFVFFESRRNEQGKWVYTDMDGQEVEAPNGMYYKDGTVYVDLNAGKGGAGLTLFTLSHELTHFIQQWSPAKYKALADFLIREYENRGVDVDALVHAKQQDLSEKRGVEVSYDEAFHEMVADSMEKMFADGNLVKKLMKLKVQDSSLFNKIKGFVDKLARKIRWYYGTLNPDSFEGQMVGQMTDAISEIQDKFAEALVEASENYQTDLTPGEEGVVVNESGDPVAYTTGDGTVQLSMKTYEDDGREAFRKYLQKCVNSNKLTKTEMQEMLDGIEEIYGVCKEFKDKFAPFSAWSDASVVRDTHGRPVFSVVTPNGDYKMNLDFSLVCKKRRTMDAVFNEMSRRGIIDDFELGQKSVVKINEIIRKYGLETACALCFVDAKRFRQASMADSFTRLYNELVESLVPEEQKGSIGHFNFGGYSTVKKVEGGIDTWDNSKLDFSHLDYVMKHYGKGTVEHKAARYIKFHAEGRKLLLRGDFMSSQGFDAVKTQNKDILKLYNSKKGTGGPKAAFGDVQYMNEIIRKARTWTPAKAYAVGGVRIQSFSDYVPRMVFDYVQMVYDLAATKLPAHAYTKEALFVKQFGLTGIKINMSLIPAIAEGGIAPGLDANGDYVWAGESFDYETAKQIQNAEGYTENCGTICVGVSYEHIKKLLNDPNIRMVIPYHKSGLNPIVAHMNKIAEFTDYTNDQRTKGKDGKALSKDFDFSKAMHDTGENASPKAVADQYLKWCVANGYTARFAEFAAEENYYKLLEDFTLYDKDGNYVPQREVRAVFPKETDAFGSMKDLIHEGLEEDAIVEGKRDKNLSAIVDEIQRTLPKTEAEIAGEQVEQADRDLEAEPQYSIRKDIVDVDGKEYDTVVALDKPVRKNVLSSSKELMGYIKRNFIGLQIPVLDGNGNTEIIEFARENETVVKNKKRHPVLGELGYIKGDTRKVVVVNLKEVLEESDYDPIYSSSDNEHGWLDERGWESRKTYVLADNIIYEAFLKIAKARDGRNILYGVNLDVKKGIAVDQGATSKRAAVLAAMPSGNKVTQPDPKVKQNSDRDSDGNKLTKEQQKFFTQSKVRNADGNLMVMYHGTSAGGHTVFDPYGKARYGLFGAGTYFTENKRVAEGYTKKGRGKNPQVYEVYLNIKNPMDMDAVADPAPWAKMFPDAVFPESGTNEDFYRAMEEYFEDEQYARWEAAEIAMGAIEDMGYDGITHIGGGRFDKGDTIRHRVFIAFQSEQIKNVDNKTPTTNPDIRYSDRATESVSNRSLLTKALEGVIQNPDEKRRLTEYGETIDKLDAQERKLSELNQKIKELSFAKGPRDTKAIRDLQIEAKQTANRINIYDKQLLRLEATKPLEAVLKRERRRVLDEMQEKYGIIKRGEKAVRDDSLPVSTDGKNKVSLVARTVKGAGVTTDEFADLIDEEVVKGGLTYISLTNDKTTQRAREWLEKEGWEDALRKWHDDVIKCKSGADMVARGAVLLNNAAQAGDKKAWKEILYDYQFLGTTTAQGLQASRILKQLLPEDKLYMAERSIEQMVEDMHLQVDIKLNEELVRAYKEAKTEKKRDAIMAQIQQDVADQIPSTFMDKWTALRYVNMLGNLRTQVRNVIGNVAMMATTRLKDMVAVGLEQIAYKASGGKFNRTKALANNRELLKAAKNDFDTVESLVLDGGKYNDQRAQSAEFAKGVMEKQRIFKNKLLEGYRKLTNWAMDKGDVIFSKAAYGHALANYLQAHGVKTGDFSAVDPALLDDARVYAVQQAQEATFRDTNTLSGWVSTLGRKQTTPAVGRVLAEGTVPFRKTPANMLVRAEEYSPMGILNSLGISLHGAMGHSGLVNNKGFLGKIAKSGEQITGAQIVESWAKTITGTGLFALGMLLRNIGVLIGGPDDDEKLDKFEDLNGQQNYAFHIGDMYFTVDFLSPSVIPMFMGAQMLDLYQENGFQFKDLESAFTSLADPMVEMSMLQGLNDTLENVQYAENNLMQIAISASLSYLTQGLTNSMLGQMERGFEDSRRSTYVDKDGAVPGWLQSALGKASAKTPGWDYNQIPFINAWGEEEENPTVALNLIYNMLSPSYISKETKDIVSKELTRLNEVQSDVNVFPSTPEKEFDGRYLTAEEYVALARTQGQTQRIIVEEMVDSGLYDGLPDAYKAKAVSLAYQYAKESAQIEELGREGFSSDWMAEIKGNTAVGIVKHVIKENIKNMYLSGDISADEAVKRRMKYHGDTAEEARDKIAYWDFQVKNPEYADWNESTVTRYKDLAPETAAHVVDVLGKLNPEDGYTNVRPIQKIEAITGDSKLSDKDKDTALRALMDDKLEAKYDAAREMGIGSGQFALAYRKYQDTEGKGAKAAVVSYFRDTFKISDSKARELYDLFNGKEKE